MSTNKNLEYIKLLDKLSETFGDSEGQSPDEIREELNEEGFDIVSAETEFYKFQQEISMAAKRQVLDVAGKQRNILESKINNIKEKIKGWTKDQIMDRFKDLSIADPNLVVAYRDLESKKEEDIKEILIDIELAQLMAENEGEDLE
ncbi:MAG: hypothetical protein PF690_16720 [Deltaproteobacteria bacterium]|jgi:hypothetical protein|nr:hypothetical protein [Deltaproteobacteria bacterium]